MTFCSSIPTSDVNTEIDIMKKAVIKVFWTCVVFYNFVEDRIQMIKAGYPVFFGCDVGKFSDKTAGIMDPALFEYEVRRAVLAHMEATMRLRQ